MTRILVVPEHLRSFSSQLQRTAKELGAISGHVGGALGGLDWEARQKAGVDGMAGDARNRANALASQAETMARYMTSKAQAFEDADRQGVGGVGSIGAQFTAVQQQWLSSPYAPVWSYPQELVSSQMRLGQMTQSQPSSALVTPVPVPAPTPQKGQGEAIAFASLIPALAFLAGPASDLKSVFLSGRTAVREAFEMTGRGINAISGTQGAITQMDGAYNSIRQFIPDARRFKLPSGLAGFALIDFPLEYVAHPEDYGLHGGAVAAAKTGIDVGIAAMPGGAQVLLINSAIQLGGSAAIWGVSESAKAISVDPSMDKLVADQADRTRKALGKLDIGRTTRDLATMLVDSEIVKWQAGVKAANELWQNPSVGNLAKLGLLANPVTSDLGLVISDPAALQKQAQNEQRVISDVLDFGVGIFQVPFELGGLWAATTMASTKGIYDRAISAGQQAFDLLSPAAPSPL